MRYLLPLVLLALSVTATGCSTAGPDVVDDPCPLLRDTFVDRGIALGDGPAAQNAFICPWAAGHSPSTASFDACQVRIADATTLDELVHHTLPECPQ